MMVMMMMIISINIIIIIIIIVKMQLLWSFSKRRFYFETQDRAARRSFRTRSKMLHLDFQRIILTE